MDGVVVAKLLAAKLVTIAGGGHGQIFESHPKEIKAALQPFIDWLSPPSPKQTPPAAAPLVAGANKL